MEIFGHARVWPTNKKELMKQEHFFPYTFTTIIRPLYKTLRINLNYFWNVEHKDEQKIIRKSATLAFFSDNVISPPPPPNSMSDFTLNILCTILYVCNVIRIINITLFIKAANNMWQKSTLEARELVFHFSKIKFVFWNRYIFGAYRKHSWSPTITRQVNL